MTMRFYLDSEFLEDGATIMPISLALVSEDGRELYIEFVFDEERVRNFSDPFVRDNVLPHLRVAPSERLTVEQARVRVEEFLLNGQRMTAVPRRTVERPEIWAYFASYDWVLLCRLWGRMTDLPRWMPMHCMDLQQSFVESGAPENVKPAKFDVEHDALADARWARDFHAALEQRRRIEQQSERDEGRRELCNRLAEHPGRWIALEGTSAAQLWKIPSYWAERMWGIDEAVRLYSQETQQ